MLSSDRLMRCGKFTVALTLALVFGQVQCVALCVLDDCNFGGSMNQQNVPPCHRHSSNSDSHKSAPCEHRVVAAVLPEAPVCAATFVAAAQPVECRLTLTSQDFWNIPFLTTAFPPGQATSSPVVLRI